MIKFFIIGFLETKMNAHDMVTDTMIGTEETAEEVTGQGREGTLDHLCFHILFLFI